MSICLQNLLLTIVHTITGIRMRRRMHQRLHLLIFEQYISAWKRTAAGYVKEHGLRQAYGGDALTPRVPEQLQSKANNNNKNIQKYI